jgi:hypothetical protein
MYEEMMANNPVDYTQLLDDLSGGYAPWLQTQSLAKMGQHGDNAARGGMVAHINADEAAMLKAMGGKGDVNPQTGLIEFDDGGGGDGGGDGGGGSDAGQGGSGSAAGGNGTDGGASGGGGSDGSPTQMPSQDVLAMQNGTFNPVATPTPAPAPAPAPDPGLTIDPPVDPTIAKMQRAQQDVNAAKGIRKDVFTPQWDNDVLDSIAQGQFKDASDFVGRAHARGQLSDIGFNSALGQLDQQNAKAHATLGNVGDQVRGNYQQQLDQLADHALQAAQSDAGEGHFDASTYQSQWDALMNDLSGRFRGEILNDTPNAGLFDPGALISFGADRQGLYNSNMPQFDFDNPAFVSHDDRHGLGTAGSF